MRIEENGEANSEEKVKYLDIHEAGVGVTETQRKGKKIKTHCVTGKGWENRYIWFGLDFR